jgi:hypothetical protein
MASHTSVDEKRIEEHLVATSNATREQLLAFGELMISEVLERRTALEGKAQNVVGWTSPLLALLLAAAPVARSSSTSTEQLVCLAVGVVSAVVAVVAGALAARVENIKWPSQVDWFRADAWRSSPVKKASSPRFLVLLPPSDFVTVSGRRGGMVFGFVEDAGALAIQRFSPPSICSFRIPGAP